MAMALGAIVGMATGLAAEGMAVQLALTRLQMVVEAHKKGCNIAGSSIG